MQDITTAGDFYLKIKTVNGFCKLVPNGYMPFFQLNDGDEYSIIMGNNGSTKCDVEILLDGENIGKYRIEAMGTNEIERPTGVNKKFTFKSAKNFTATDSSSGTYPANGKISLIFNPEIKKIYTVPTTQVNGTFNTNLKLDGKSGSTPDINSQLYGAGSTILGRESKQVFTNVAAITEVDKSRTATIEACFVITVSANNQIASATNVGSSDW